MEGKTKAGGKALSGPDHYTRLETEIILFSFENTLICKCESNFEQEVFLKQNIFCKKCVRS